MGTDNPEAKNELFGRMFSSLEFFLNPQIFADDECKRQISNHLTNGDLVVIRDALQEPVATKMFACLNEFSNWKVYEGYKDHFHYHHHNIYEKELYPTDLNWCREIFGSQPTKSLIQELSQRDCDGEIIFSASWYLPGDHSLPHDDVSNEPGAHRQVAFIWPDSFHHVTQVSPYATSKRLAISGWWTSISATEDYVKQPDNGTSRQSLVELI